MMRMEVMVEEEEKKDKKGEKREEVLQTVKSLLADHFFRQQWKVNVCWSHNMAASGAVTVILLLGAELIVKQLISRVRNLKTIGHCFKTQDLRWKPAR